MKNLDHLTHNERMLYDECYKQGERSYTSHQSNPYKYPSLEHNAFEAGWMSAMDMLSEDDYCDEGWASYHYE